MILFNRKNILILLFNDTVKYIALEVIWYTDERVFSISFCCYDIGYGILSRFLLKCVLKNSETY